MSPPFVINRQQLNHVENSLPTAHATISTATSRISAAEAYVKV